MSEKFKPGDRVRSLVFDLTGTIIGPHPSCDGGVVVLFDKGDDDYNLLMEHNLELIPEQRKVSGWINQYGDGQHGYWLFDTREEADRYRCSQERIACIYISGTEGIEP